MKSITHAFAGLALVAAFSMNPAQAAVIEPFTGGQLSAPGWSTGIGADASAFLATPAPDGSYGIALSEGEWSYNNYLSLLPGQTLSAWINPGPSPTIDNNAQGGRIYLGFDAGASGAYSFVAASDSNELGFQDNTGYATPAFAASAPQSYNDQWYLLSVALSADGGTATAYLYDTDGTTLLNTLSQTGLSSANTGLALRGVGGAAITTISTVPLPAAWPLMASALGLLGFFRRRA